MQHFKDGESKERTIGTLENTLPLSTESTESTKSMQVNIPMSRVSTENTQDKILKSEKNSRLYSNDENECICLSDKVLWLVAFQQDTDA